MKQKNASRDFRHMLVALVAAGLLASASIGLSGCGGEPGDEAGRGSISVPRAGAGVVDTTKGEIKKPAPKPRTRVKD